MKELNHLVIIPDGNRRTSRRNYLSELYRKNPENFRRLIDKFPKKASTPLDERIKEFVETGSDPHYKCGGVDYLDLRVEDYLKAPESENLTNHLYKVIKSSAKILDRIIKWNMENSRIPNITIYALQYENLERTPEQIRPILRVQREQYNEWINNEIISDVSFNFIGNLEELGRRFGDEGKLYVKSAKELERKSKNRFGVYISVLDNVEDQVNQSMKKDKKGIFYVKNLLVPTVDCVLRSANEKRISNCMTIQTGYAEYVFRPEYFPDFNIDTFEEAIKEFKQRDRRFGT